MNPRLGKCHIRLIKEEDCPTLERIYFEHQGNDVPLGYFEEFKNTIRDPNVVYFIAESDAQIIGGGGVADFQSGPHASLAFGVIARSKCRMGYGTSLLLARLYFVSCILPGCRLTLQATEWTADFFARIGFIWQGQDEDENGNRFLYGSQILYPHLNKTFLQILDSNGVTLDISIIARIKAAEQVKRGNQR
jgi:hypothetical protein